MLLSDVARMKEQIKLETQAAIRALKDPAVVANHESIIARMERMAEHIQALDQAGKKEEVKAFLLRDDLWT